MFGARREQPPRAEAALDVAALYREHAQRVARWAQRLGGPTADVEDVIQEVFMVVHRELKNFRGDAQLSTWLFRITENVVRHRRRKDRLRRWVGGSATDVAGKLASGRPTPVEALERREASALVYRVLDGMNEKYRTLIILFELEGLSGDEVAELTGTRPSALWVTLHRARAQFLARLKKEERTR